MFCQIISRLVTESHLASNPLVIQATMRLLASTLSKNWRVDMLHLIACCAAALGGQQMDRPEARVLDRLIVEAVLAHIDACYVDSRFTLRDAAQAIRRSESHVSRIFRKATGSRFLVYLRRRRVAAAQAQLVNAALSLKEIAARTGFNDASQFSRQFRATTGMTPTVFRARALARHVTT
jgi:AraC-like DNA-binding protein